MENIGFIKFGLCALAIVSAVHPSSTAPLGSDAWAEVAQHQNVVLSSTRVSKPQAKSSSKRLVLPKQVKTPQVPYRGWVYLADKLRQDGVQESEIRSVFLDPRMPYFSFISFKLRPREHHTMYTHFYKDETLQIGRDFLHENSSTHSEAEKIFKVNRHIIAAILLIETHAGKATGKEQVVNRLARLASIAEPNNVALNFEILSKEDPSITFQQVQQRAEYLENTFYPEVRALVDLKHKRGVDILALRGSSAGAFGMPQFLPSSYLRFAVDANRDGKISLFHKADAIWSAANYLSHFGWRDNASVAEKRKVLWKYNHSEAYIDTVLEVADRLK